MFPYHVPLVDRIYSGSHIKILVLGRSQIQSFVPTIPSLVISVTDPDTLDAEIVQTPFVRGILRLQFHDCEPKIKIPELAGFSQDIDADIVMTTEDTRRILAFVEEHLDQAELIVCQCEAGVSRSAVIAAALSQLLQGEDQFFFNHYWPNRWVYDTLLKASPLLQ